jgi:hypothetical protein
VVINPMTDDKKPIIISRPEVPRAPRRTRGDLPHGSRDKSLQTGIRHQFLEQQPANAQGRYPMHRPTESRKATRYQFSSAAVIRWLDADNQIHEGAGEVYDISTCGAFVESHARVLLNSPIEMEITPPRMESRMNGPKLHFEGKVVRTENNQGRIGFAVAGVLDMTRLFEPGR